MNELIQKLEDLTPEQFYKLIMKMCRAYLDPIHAAGACYCLECKHYKLLGGAKWCVLHMSRTHADDFCSYGARIEEDEQ